jgi:hypothetical protein
LLFLGGLGASEFLRRRNGMQYVLPEWVEGKQHVLFVHM